MAAVVASDQWSSAWARAALAHGPTRVFIGGAVQLRLLFNRGAMLGLGSEHAAWVLAAGIVGTLLLGFFSLRRRQGGLALALMTGGALGNVITRLRFHQVTDFIYIPPYPAIFNLADVALRVGVLWFIIALLVHDRSAARPKAGY
ncbi:MAG: signal peptidase II [Thermaerobacter sp.]|nr:signal peptidase II [Thermaerobacter sp.]